MKVFPLSTTSDIFITKALPLLEKCYEQISYLNPNQYPEYPHKPFRHLLAFGASVAVHVFNDSCVFDTWKQLYLAHPKEWIFAFISYDAKNSVEALTNLKEPGIEFNAACFFIPQHVWEITSEGIIIHKGNASALIQEIEEYEDQKTDTATTIVSSPLSLISKETYLHTISRIQLFLEEGNAYEINFCMPFKGKGTIQPANTYL
ncbi:MAG: anthranilate synthase component I family protein, partial [Cytophagales bacterium]|nr:anthranilate synthase component I family protein [Cytophaga sp.]